MKPKLLFFLEGLQKTYHLPEHLPSDPLEFVHRYKDPWDQEAVALISALLAYGRVVQIKKAVQEALTRIESLAKSPKDFVRNLSDPSFKKLATRTFKGFCYRFNRGEDLIALFSLLEKSWDRFGSLGGHFLSHHPKDTPTIEIALSGLISDWKTWIKSPSKGLLFLLNSPADKSCCKRWCLFLRWMGRKDGLDLGLWFKPPSGAYADSLAGRLSPHQLIFPLDTHTSRISRYLGLTQRPTPNWETALEVTSHLKALDPSDPTRFDFALSRLGILELCQRTYRATICQTCQLYRVCLYAQTQT